MVFFLYISGVVMILLSTMLFNLQCKKLMKKVYTDRAVGRCMVKYLMADVMISCILMIIITFVIPSLMWTFGTKEDRVNDIIMDQIEIMPISQSNKKIYVKESSKDNEIVYTVNDSKTPISFNVKSTEIIEGNSIKKPEYRLVDQYKINQLKGDSIFTENVNDMYANIYLNKEKSTFVGTKVKIYVPKNSVEKR